MRWTRDRVESGLSLEHQEGASRPLLLPTNQQDRMLRAPSSQHAKWQTTWSNKVCRWVSDLLSAVSTSAAFGISCQGKFFAPFSSRCPCGSIIDSYGDHVLGCGSGNLWIKRHDALCNIVFHTLLEDHSGTRREQHCGDYDNSRPGDVYHPDFLIGRPA